MSKKEVRAYATVRSTLVGRMTSKEAAEREAVSDRTIRRWKKKVETSGAKGLIHGNRRKISPRRVPARERSRIGTIIKNHYGDFSPSFATEKLRECHCISRDPKTIRKIMIEYGLWVPRSKRPGGAALHHRQWRERKAHRGELIQFDGSYHDWFEGRGGLGETCLLAAIDDATGEIIHAEFGPHEGVLPVMGFWVAYMNQNGLPKAVYLDRFSTYKMHLTVARDNPDLKTQLQRAMKTLGVDLIFALSPQAKGRVERLFGTLQDRLVKEMRLRRIKTVEEGNVFLRQTFIGAFNRRFGVSAREKADFHRQVSRNEMTMIRDVLCRQETRTTQSDFTISFRNQWYQILPTVRLAVRPKDEVCVREYPNGAISFFIRNRLVAATPIAKRSHGTGKNGVSQTLVPTNNNRTFSFPGKEDKFISV